MVPIYKKGNHNGVENYTGISLLCTVYKVYTEILRSKLEKEVEEKVLLPENRADFRKGRRTLDNIFVLNHVIQREKKKKNKHVYTAFIDLKAVFDNIDREELLKIMEEKRVNKELLGED